HNDPLARARSSMVNVRQEGAVDVGELDSIVDRIAIDRDCRETLSRRCNRSRLVRAAQKRDIALRGRRYRGQPYVVLAAPGGQSRRQRPYAKHQTASHSKPPYDFGVRTPKEPSAYAGGEAC